MQVSGSEIAKILGGFAAILIVPTIGYIYSQGADASTKEQLSSTMMELNSSIKALTIETSSLSIKIEKEIVRGEVNAKRIDNIESRLEEQSEKIATISGRLHDGK